MASKKDGIDKLRNAGFTIGEITFKPSDSKDDILGELYNGEQVKKGQKVPLGSTIDLVIGGGLEGKRIPSPCLIGHTLSEAEFLLDKLNLGHIDYTKVEGDSTTAVIYKQKPEPYKAIRVGEPIDIFLIQELPFDVNICDKDSLNTK